MITIHKKKIAVVLCAALLVTNVLFPMDIQEEVVVVTEQSQEQSNESSVAWYKDEENQKIATRVIITAAVVYAIAVRMGKVPSPFGLCSAVANCWAKKNNAKNNPAETDKMLNNHENKGTGTEPVKHETTTQHKNEQAEGENTLVVVGKQWFADATKFFVEKAKCFESGREGFDPLA